MLLRLSENTTKSKAKITLFMLGGCNTVTLKSVKKR